MIDLNIAGDGGSTPFLSLRDGLEGIKLSSQIGGLNHPNLITHIHVLISLESLVTNLVSIDFDIQNPLDTDMVIEFVQGEASLNGTEYAFFGQRFEGGFVIPSGQTANSGVFGNVLLTQGALSSVDIVTLGVLDISMRTTVGIGGQGRYDFPWLKISQTDVPTAYDLDLV